MIVRGLVFLRANSNEMIDHLQMVIFNTPALDVKDVMIGGLPDKTDAVFLMDGSGSIDELDEFYNAKQLVSQVLMKMNIGEKKVR